MIGRIPRGGIGFFTEQTIGEVDIFFPILSSYLGGVIMTFLAVLADGALFFLLVTVPLVMVLLILQGRKRP